MPHVEDGIHFKLGQIIFIQLKNIIEDYYNLETIHLTLIKLITIRK